MGLPTLCLPCTALFQISDKPILLDGTNFQSNTEHMPGFQAGNMGNGAMEPVCLTLDVQADIVNPLAQVKVRCRADQDAESVVADIDQVARDALNQQPDARCGQGFDPLAISFF